ncbi:hypothetical protein ACHAPU_005378 [Fusarium lateritium]
MPTNSDKTKPSTTTPASGTGGDPKLLPPKIVSKLKKWAKKDAADEDTEEGGVKLDQCSDTEEGGVKL